MGIYEREWNEGGRCIDSGIGSDRAIWREIIEIKVERENEI